MARYETTLGCAARALVAGAAFGAVFISALWTGLNYYRIVHNLPAMLLIYFVLFAAGLLVLAAPAWWLLHRFGQRDRAKAVTLGVTLTLVSYLAFWQYTARFTALFFAGPAPISRAAGLDWPSLVSLRTPLRYWLTLIEGAAWYAIAGGLIGLLIWTMAYRPSGSEDPGS